MSKTTIEKKGITKFEVLTAYIEKLEGDDSAFSKPEEHAGTKGAPFVLPHPVYSDVVHGFMRDLHDFSKSHPEYDTKNYYEIVKDAGIKDLKNADVEKMDEKIVVNTLFYIVRQERFCDGLILSCIKDGSIQRLLTRLKTIDEEFKA